MIQCRSYRIPVLLIALLSTVPGYSIAPRNPALPQAEPPSQRPTGRPGRVGPVVRRLAQATGALVLADSTVSEEPVTPPTPETEVTADKLEAYLSQFVQALPEGAFWAKLYLPPPPKDHPCRETM